MISLILSLALADFIIKKLHPVTFSIAPDWVSDGFSRGYYEPYSNVQGSVGHNRLTPFPRTVYANYYLNEFGYRGDNWDINQQNNILFFGGSSTFSFHDEIQDTWPNLVIECLNSRSFQTYYLVNLSIPGNSIFDVPHQIIQKGLRIKHEAIVINNLWNDMKFIKRMADDKFVFFTTPVVKNTDFIAKFFKKYVPFKNFFGLIYLVYRNEFNTITEDFDMQINKTQPQIKIWLREVRQQYENVINLTSTKTKIFLLKQSLLLNEGSEDVDLLSGFNLLGLTKSEMIEARDAYYLMLEELRDLHSNVMVIDVASSIPKDLEHFEDHVHLQKKGQKILGHSVCGYLSNAL